MFDSLYNKKNGFALIGVILAVLIIAAIIFGSSFFWKNSEAPSPVESIDTLEQAKDDLGNVNDRIEERNDVIKEDETLDNGAISVSGIESGQEISSPVTISGEGAAFENTLVVELRNSEHEALVSEPVTIRSAEMGQKGPFEITLTFQFGNTDKGYVAVYEQSAKDGSEMNLLEIPVKYKTEED